MGCAVPESTWRAWERIMVSPRDPVFVTDAAIRAYESGRKRPGKAVAERLRRLGKTEPHGSVGAERPGQIGLLQSQGVHGTADGTRKADMRSRKPD
jgi:hypothetical protein